MDVASHALWGVALFRRRVKWWAAGAAGALPDLISFLPARIQELTQGKLNVLHEVRPLADYPSLTMPLYNFSHSVAGLACVGLLTWAALQRSERLARQLAAPGAPATSSGALTAWLLGPWALHLALDAPLHSVDFFPTPLLWPFSERVVAGIPWAQPGVWIPNLVLLGLALFWTWPERSEAGPEEPEEPEEGRARPPGGLS